MREEPATNAAETVVVVAVIRADIARHETSLRVTQAQESE